MAETTPPCTNTELMARLIAAEVSLAAFKDLMSERDRVNRTMVEGVSRVITEMDRRIEVQFSEKDKAVAAALAAAKEAVAAALSAADRAVAKAEIATESRFESVNEFRAQLGDQTRTLMSRSEFDAKFDALNQKISAVEKATERNEGKGIGWTQIGSLMLGVALVAGVAFEISRGAAPATTPQIVYLPQPTPTTTTTTKP